jgi:fructokinase
MASESIIIGAGELLWDYFGEERRAGGAPANVAFHAQQLGLKGVIFSRVGQDSSGDELLGFLSQRGLSTDYVQRDAHHETGRVTVDLTSSEHPQFTIHENAAWDYLQMETPVAELAAQASAICFGTLAQRTEESRQAIHEMLSHASEDCLVVYDANLRPPWFGAEQIDQSLHAANIVKLNQQEAMQVASLLSMNIDEVSDVARMIQSAFDVDVVCVTRGAEGCLLVGRNGTAVDTGTEVIAEDVVGAGDAFTAALIYARLRGWSLQVLATFANEIGALVAGRAGAMPSMQTEFADAVERFQG